MRNVLLAIALCGCGASAQLPSTAQVQHVSQATVDIAVQICLLAHGVNAAGHAGAELEAGKAKIDAVCMPVLASLQDLSEVAASKAVDDLRTQLGRILQ
jgi:hypothetical protein